MNKKLIILALIGVGGYFAWKKFFKKEEEAPAIDPDAVEIKEK